MRVFLSSTSSYAQLKLLNLAFNVFVHSGPRKAGCVASILWPLGLVLGAIGIYIHQIFLLWIGSGVIGGIGLGIGYISPVRHTHSTHGYVMDKLFI